VPRWHVSTKDLVRNGRLRVAGIAEEQHADRARLFAQWHRMDWPIMMDSMNLLGITGVPVTLFIDEHGVIRAINPEPSALPAFLDKSFDKPAVPPPAVPTVPERARLGTRPAADTFEGWRQCGDELVLWGGAARLNDAVAAYERATALAPQDGAVHFRLGVAYEMRHDSGADQPGDFARAAAQWGEALAINPNQYIWRRRIQQYGPRLQKPYSFYDWVNEARAAIQERGETSMVLAVEPSGAELAQPQKEFVGATGSNPDPEGRIQRDEEGLIGVETAVVPARSKPGEPTRLHVLLRPNAQRQAHWNNEAQDLVFWVDLPPGWQGDSQRVTVPNPRAPTSRESRSIEMELRSPPQSVASEVTLEAFALYYVCEGAKGVCFYRRQDIPVKVRLGN
jgi:hypothetical protein